MSRIRIKILRYPNGRALRTPQDVANNFDGTQLLETFRDGSLARWLVDTAQNDLRVAVEALSPDAEAPELVRNLGEIFGCPVEAQAWLGESEVARPQANARDSQEKSRWHHTENRFEVTFCQHPRDLSLRDLLRTCHPHALSRTILVGHENGTVVAWHRAEQQAAWEAFQATLPVGTQLHAVAGDGCAVAFQSSNGDLFVQTIDTGPALVARCVKRAAFGPENEWLTLVGDVNEFKKSLVSFDFTTGHLFHPWENEPALFDVNCNNQNEIIFSKNTGGFFVGKAVNIMRFMHPWRLFTFNVASAGRVGLTQEELDSSSFQPQHTTLIKFTTCGTRVLRATSSGFIEYWTSKLERRMWRSGPWRGEIRDLCAAADSKFGAFLSSEDGLVLFSLGTGSAAASNTSARARSATALAVLDDDTFVTGHSDGSISVWDTTLSAPTLVLVPEGQASGSSVVHLAIR
jgi:WD40 repeat protein